MTSEKKLRPGWRTVRFGDVVRQVKDKVDPDTAGIDRYVAGEHMDTDDLRIRRWGNVGDGYLGPAFTMRFQPGQVLYGSRRTYLRKVALADFEGICANTTFVVESSTPDLLPEFLPFVMTAESFHEHSIKQSKGSVNPYINFSDLKWYEFALPSLDEQQRVVDLLHVVDGLGERYRSAAARATELITAMVEVEWGTEPKASLSSLGTIHTGKTPRTDNPTFWQPPELPFVTPSDFGEQVTYIETASRMLSREGATKTRVFPRHSLLQTCIGARFGRVGITLAESCCNQQVNALTGLPEPDAVFLAHMLASRSGQAALRSFAGTTTLPQVKKSSWSSIEVPWPDSNVRLACVTLIWTAQGVLESVQKLRAELAEWRALFLEHLLGTRNV